MSTFGAGHKQALDTLLTDHAGLGWKSTFLTVPEPFAVIVHTNIFK
jgi:hypothetical protein